MSCVYDLLSIFSHLEPYKTLQCNTRMAYININGNQNNLNSLQKLKVEKAENEKKDEEFVGMDMETVADSFR